MSEHPADNRKTDEAPRKAPTNDPIDKAREDGVRLQRDHIIDRTGQDPLASRDD